MLGNADHQPEADASRGHEHGNAARIQPPHASTSQRDGHSPRLDSSVTPATAQPSSSSSSSHQRSSPSPSSKPDDESKDIARQNAQHRRRKYADTKDCSVYQLSPRPESAAKWSDVVAERRREVDGAVAEDAKAPSKPMAFINVDEAAIVAGSVNASKRAREATRFTSSSSDGQRFYGLPFAQSFASAPLLGKDSLNNIIVRTSSGQTLFERLSSTSEGQHQQMQRDLDKGGGLLKSLFDAEPAAPVRHGAKVIDCGGLYDGEVLGWTQEHQQRGEAADNALRWSFGLFHRHVTVLASLLEDDLQNNLEKRMDGWEMYCKKIGEAQSRLTHHWWTTATFEQGYRSVEAQERDNFQPVIVVALVKPFVLFLTHPEGFFKAVVRPGQVVFLASHYPFQVHPLPDESSTTSRKKSLGIAETHRYAVSFRMHRAILTLTEGDEEMSIRRIAHPPQPAEEDKKAAGKRLNLNDVGMRGAQPATKAQQGQGNKRMRKGGSGSSGSTSNAVQGGDDCGEGGESSHTREKGCSDIAAGQGEGTEQQPASLSKEGTAGGQLAPMGASGAISPCERSHESLAPTDADMAHRGEGEELPSVSDAEQPQPPASEPTAGPFSSFFSSLGWVRR